MQTVLLLYAPDVSIDGESVSPWMYLMCVHVQVSVNVCVCPWHSPCTAQSTYIYFSYSPVNNRERERTRECGLKQTEQTFMSIRALVQNALIGMKNCLAVVIYFPFIVISFTLRYRTKCGIEWNGANGEQTI